MLTDVDYSWVRNAKMLPYVILLRPRMSFLRVLLFMWCYATQCSVPTNLWWYRSCGQLT